jgi:hypothetical protein
MQSGVRQFFDANEAWLASMLNAGREAGAVRFEGDPVDAARSMAATLEGAMLIARAYEDYVRFRSVGARLLEDFAPARVT